MTVQEWRCLAKLTFISLSSTASDYDFAVATPSPNKGILFHPTP